MDALSAIQTLSDMNPYAALHDRILRCTMGSIDDLSGFVVGSLQPSSNSTFLNSQNNNEDFSESTESSSTSSSSNLQPATAKLIDFRDQKIAAFDVNGKDMICLPQVYEIFLKNMVGGLHTVYTKLRRLDINPLICNVEQVRALRSLGAIQPGVNRCKLIKCSDFDKLYDDCTSTCTRPGRPSKRGAFDDWNSMGVVKKEKSSEDSSGSLTSPSMTSSRSNGGFSSMPLPQFTTQQLIMQHFVAMAQNKTNNNRFNGGPVETEESESPPDQRASDDGTPLNLSKSSSGNSENDVDSLDNMRKEDTSSNNSASDRGASSNSNSMSAEACSSGSNNRDENALMNKVVSLIEITSEQFKHERQELWRERSEIQLLRESFHKIVQEERELRQKLECQMKKCNAYEKKYKYTRHQLVLARAEIRRNNQNDEEESDERENRGGRGSSGEGDNEQSEGTSRENESSERSLE